MSQLLTERRCQRIKPLFAHIAETVELERFEDHSNARDQDGAVTDAASRLAQRIQELDDQDREALLSVMRHETTVLLTACITQAALLKIKKDAGIGAIRPS
jgi:hypothetical protein